MGRPPVVYKVADASDFTLTPTLSLKGERELKGPAMSNQGLLIVPSPFGGGLGWGRPPVVCKVADASDFTLTPTLSLKGEGELRGPAMSNFRFTRGT